MTASSTTGNIDDLALCDTGQLGVTSAILKEIAHAPPRQLELGPGDRIGRFSVIRTIGRGGSGIVHEARDLELGRHVALKLVRTRGDPNSRSADALEMLFRREADAAARLNHPNVVTLHDFGTFDSNPYLILELLEGETLEARIARGPLTVDEAVAVMIQIARGLAYAHRMGVIHRDLKPANVFLTREGPVKVLDFGLARIEAALGLAELPGTDESSATDTTTRNIVGTPAYMAPEQWRAETADERTDVYAAGLILYEMLTGRRPWPAADPRVAALAPQPAPSVVGAPAPLAALIASALVKDRELRLASAALLADGLTAIKRSLDSARTQRRARLVRNLFIATVPLLVGGAWAAKAIVERVNNHRTIAAYVDQSDATVAVVRHHERLVAVLRRDALAKFDWPATTWKSAIAETSVPPATTAEALWSVALASGVQVDRLWARAGQTLERAFVLDPARDDVRQRLAEVLLARAGNAERDHHLEQRDELAERLETYGETPARRRWNQPARLSVETLPPRATVLLQRHDAGAASGPVRVAAPSSTPIVDHLLPAGSYLLVVTVPGRAPVRYPVLLGRGEAHDVTIAIPSHVPEGFVYVPAGRFLYGSAIEVFRSAFNAQPEHAVTTPAYLVARHEVTFADWISYLEELSPEDRALRTPRIDGVARASAAARSGGNDLRLRRLRNGGWELTLLGRKLPQDAPFVYAGRHARASQSWLRFPVAGVSFEDGQAYAAWLASSGRVPGARLCSEHEWERAARGADGRLYPSGDRLAADDANLDETYGRKTDGYGPDEVGSHPGSDSPFGVADMAGNVWELVSSNGAAGDVVQRGGSWFQDEYSARSDNRDLAEPRFHSVLIGVRICASIQPAD